MDQFNYISKISIFKHISLFKLHFSKKKKNGLLLLIAVIVFSLEHLFSFATQK